MIISQGKRGGPGGPRRGRDKGMGEGRGGETPQPRITFELINDKHLNVVAEWPKGADMEAFGHLLLYLCQGKLVAPVASAIAMYAHEVGDMKTGEQIHRILQGGGNAPSPPHTNAPAPNRVACDPGLLDDDEPLVCPTQAVRANVKPFSG